MINVWPFRIRAFCTVGAAILAAGLCDPQAPQIRVVSHLVNLTILATDKKGNPVADLKPEEYEIREDGVAQRISSFEAAVAPALLSREVASLRGPERLKPPETLAVRPRFIVFVVDNSATEFADRQRALEATRQWVENRQERWDLVELVSLGMGIRIWQTFTTERNPLLAALKAMQGESPPPAESQRVNRLLQELSQCANMPRRDIAMRCGEGAAQVFTSEQTGELNQRKGTLKALVASLAALPGEKRLVYFGDGFLTNPGVLASKAYATYFGDNPLLTSRLNALDDLHQVTSAALRANVTLFTIDAHGLRAVPPGGEPDQLTAPLGGGYFAKNDFENERIHGTEDSLSVLAADTGGRWFYGNNDLTRFADQAVGSLEGTYYASYVPSNANFDGRYRKIDIRSSRPGVALRTRGGYFAVEVHEIPLEAKVSEPTPRQGWYLVDSRIEVAAEGLKWQGRGEKKTDLVSVTRTLENSKGELISTQVELTSLTPQSPRVEVGWLLTPGHYTCTFTLTEVDTGNFGSTTFQVAVPASNSAGVP